MRPPKPQAVLARHSNFEFYNPDFQSESVEQSIANLRKENEMLRRMAAILERQTHNMRAAWEKPKLG